MLISCRSRARTCGPVCSSDTLALGDLGIDAATVGWAGAGQNIVAIEDAPQRQAGEVVEDDGTAADKIVAFLDNLKVI